MKTTLLPELHPDHSSFYNNACLDHMHHNYTTIANVDALPPGIEDEAYTTQFLNSHHIDPSMRL